MMGSRPPTHTLPAGVLLAALATPAAADGFDIMGTVMATANDAPLTLWVPFDREAQEAYATRLKVGVMTIYTIGAFSGTPGESREVSHLSLSLTIAGGTVRTGDLTYFAGADAPILTLSERLGHEPPHMVIMPSYMAILFSRLSLKTVFQSRPYWEPVDAERTLAQFASDLAKRNAMINDALALPVA